MKREKIPAPRPADELPTLLQLLLERQQCMHYDDYRFAEFLGVPAESWKRARGGEPIDQEILSGAVKRFPDLNWAVLRLLGGIEESPEQSEAETNE